MLGNEIVESFQMNLNCDQIDTRCGWFKFDPSSLLKSGKQCYIKENVRTFYSKISVDSFVLELKKDANLINYRVQMVDYKEFIEFKYVDSVNLIQTVLADSFYMDIVLRETKTATKSGSDMASYALIIQSIFDRDFIWEGCQIESVQQLDSEIPTYMVSMKNNKERAFSMQEGFGSIVSRKERSTYEVWFISKSDTR